MENSYTCNQLFSVIKNKLELRLDDIDRGLPTKNQLKDVQGSARQSVPTKGQRSGEQAWQLTFRSFLYSKVGAGR